MPSPPLILSVKTKESSALIVLKGEMWTSDSIPTGMVEKAASFFSDIKTSSVPGGPEIPELPVEPLTKRDPKDPCDTCGQLPSGPWYKDGPTIINGIAVGMLVIAGVRFACGLIFGSP